MQILKDINGNFLYEDIQMVYENIQLNPKFCMSFSAKYTWNVFNYERFLEVVALILNIQTQHLSFILFSIY